MKAALIGLLTFASLSSAMAACKVDGISDSPQKRSCSFPKIATIDLRCENDQYILNWKKTDHKVQVAFHMDVEEGDSLLVFKAEKLTLTLDGKSGYLEAQGLEVQGKCQ